MKSLLLSFMLMLSVSIYAQHQITDVNGDDKLALTFGNAANTFEEYIVNLGEFTPNDNTITYSGNFLIDSDVDFNSQFPLKISMIVDGVEYETQAVLSTTSSEVTIPTQTITSITNDPFNVDLKISFDATYLSQNEVPGATQFYFDDFSINANPIACAVLPIKIISFGAYMSRNECNIQWKVSETEHVSHYVIQYSTDGEQFISLDQVESLGSGRNEIKEYDFIHNVSSLEKDNVKVLYYRILQFDNDGKKETSDIIMINLNAYNSLYSIYPNPTCGSFTINLEHEVSSIIIYNTAGVKVKDYRNVVKQLDISDLMEGVYFISVNNQSFTKLIKL